MRKINSIVVTGILTIAFSVNIHAQSVISFMSGNLDGGNISLAFTAGEVVSGSFESANMRLTGVLQDGNPGNATSNDFIEDLPKVFRLNQNYPNPFNPSTDIAFDLPKSSDVRLEIFNSIGAKVATLIDGRKPAGSHVTRFDAAYLASGIYFYRLTADHKVISTKKMLLIK